MSSTESQNKKSHAFSIILVMIVLMLVGAACIPMLNIQYNPVHEDLSLSVSASGQGSARVMEAEVASVIEGAMNTVNGVSDIRTSSYQNYCFVSMNFKEGTDMETTRFDVATRLRQIRNKLPEGTQCGLSGSAGGGGRSNPQLLSYTINADMPAQEIVRYAQDHLITPLSRIDGVAEVNTSGAMPFEWVLSYDPDALRDAGLHPNDLSSALNAYYQNSIVGTQAFGDKLMLVRLKSRDLQSELEQIPISKVNGRLFHMGDFATVTYQEQLPVSYDRINGLNTIDIYVNGEEGINTLTVCDAVKAKMEELEAQFPENFAIRLNYDASQSLSNEINKIFLRAVMSLAILLLFVLLVSRSFRYLAVIGLTITVNLLSAVIFYKLFGVDIELYSMAGITVSLGIIIDTAIVIADHYTYYGNRKVMTSITGALLTTIAALLLIFFLPEQSRNNLTGFVWVIVINLTLSMIVAFLFVPALLEKMPLKNKGVVRNSVSRLRRLVRQTARYERLVNWGRHHRWLYVVLIIYLFGLPIYLLPSQVQHKYRENKEYKDYRKGGLVGLYNSTIGSKWYQKHKAWFEFPLGGAINLFHLYSNGHMSYYREEENPEVVLRIYPEMTEGCTVQQLNDIALEMENWLQQFPEISMFHTSLSGRSGVIEVHFKDEFQHGRFPLELKEKAWGKATRYGGATWSIPAINQDDKSLQNKVYRTSWTNTITLFGYSYDLLYRYAEDLIDSLKQNRRVSDAGFASASSYYDNQVPNEFCLEYDEQAITSMGLNVGRYYSYLGEQLYDNRIGDIISDGVRTPVRLTSSKRDYYDLWHIRNDIVDIDSVKTRLNDVGSITKRRTGLDIQRRNQEYILNVGYEYVGSYELRSHMENKLLDRFEKNMAMGFHTGRDSSYYWWSTSKQQTALILVVVLVIFMICASLFESLRQAGVIVLLIPVSFIGLMLVYPFSGVSFGQGGFAAMIMLCGITVNAGIYLTSEFRTVTASANNRNRLKCYVKAFNRKIVPTLLTILSTVLGLIPFLFDGKQSPFWLSFAVGVMAGMLFSVIAIVLIMPAFFPLEKK